MKRILLSTAFCMSLVAPVHAQGVPTVDTKNTLQTIKQLEVLLDDIGIQEDMLVLWIAQASE